MAQPLFVKSDDSQSGSDVCSVVTLVEIKAFHWTHLAATFDFSLHVGNISKLLFLRTQSRYVGVVWLRILKGGSERPKSFKKLSKN